MNISDFTKFKHIKVNYPIKKIEFKEDIFCEFDNIKYKINGICLETDDYSSYGEVFLEVANNPEFACNINVKYIMSVF